MHISFTAVFIGPLVKVFGAKRMTQAGTVVIFVGTILTALAPNVYTLYLTQGLIMGELLEFIFRYADGV